MFVREVPTHQVFYLLEPQEHPHRLIPFHANRLLLIQSYRFR